MSSSPSLDPRWEQVFAPYSLATSHLFKVWTLSTDHAQAFQRQWNRHLDAAQPTRYVDDVREGDFYGIALSMCDLNRKKNDATTLVLLREAVELLHMLAFVDLALWRNVFIESFCLKDEWTDHVVPVWAFLPYDALARSVDIANADVEVFFHLLQMTPRSAIYAKAKTLMFEILGIEEGSIKQRRLPTHMDMTLLLTPTVSSFVPRAKLEPHLRAMEKALKATAECSPHDGVLPIRVIATLVTVMVDEDVVDTQCLDALAALSAVTPIEYIEMHLKVAERDKGVHPWTTYKKLLDHIALDLNANASTRHLGVALAQGDMRRFIAVCSAVRESRCVGKFVVRAASTVWPRTEWLRWLAWGCTRGSGNRADLVLTINIETLTEDDVDVLRSVFQPDSIRQGMRCKLALSMGKQDIAL